MLLPFSGRADRLALLKGFNPSAELVDRAWKEYGIDARDDRVLNEFKDWHIEHNKLPVDIEAIEAAYRRWIRREPRFAEQSPQRPQQPSNTAEAELQRASREAAESAAEADRAAQWAAELAARRPAFRARLANAIGDDAPSLNDIELATELVPSLERAGMPVSWRQFADEDPRACADLCKRLAEIARTPPFPARGEIRRLIATVEWERRRRQEDAERHAGAA